MTDTTSAIQVQTADQTPISRTLEVQVDAARVARAYDRAYRNLARQARVRGFRPGKVPRAVLERMYAGQVAEEIEQALVQETLPQALAQAGVSPVSEPSVDARPPAAGESFRYRARVEVAPEIVLPELRGLPAERPPVLVAEDDVERELEALRQRSAPIVEAPEGTVAESGHILVIDFEGRVDGEPLAGGPRTGVEIEIGAGQILPGFDEQLIGAHAGDERHVRLDVPAEAAPELAGRPAEFAVRVQTVKRRDVPALDDEFAKDMGDFDSLEALRERIRSDLRAVRERAAQSEARRSLMDALLIRTPFEVPPGLVERQLAQRLSDAHRQLEGAMDHDRLHAQLDRWREEWRAAAAREVRETFVLDAVARAEQLRVEDAEIDTRVGELSETRGVDAAKLRQALAEPAAREGLRAQLLRERALDFLLSEAKVSASSDT